MRWSVAILAFLLVTVLGGCTSPDPSIDTDPRDTPAENEHEDTENETGPEDEKEEPTPPTVVTCEATAQAGVQGNGVGIVDNSPCWLEEAYGSNLSGFQTAILEVTWDSLGPAVDTVQIIIESDECTSSLGTGCTHGEARGQEQPLRLDLDEDALSEYGDDDMRLYARPEPVASGERFTVHLSLFLDDAPEDYTALE